MDPLEQLAHWGNEMNEFVSVHDQSFKHYVYSSDLKVSRTMDNILEVEKQQRIETEQQLEIINPNQIYVSNLCVGAGFFSQVFIGTHNNIEVACKRYEMKGDMFYNETANLKLLNLQQYVPRFYGILQLDVFYYIVMEMVHGITIEHYLNTNPNPFELFSILRKIIKALIHMHSIGVTHADISNSNILVYNVGNSSRIKFVDFGISCNSNPNIKVHYKGKNGYIAPELLDEGKTRKSLNEKTDVYSFSVLLKEILARNILLDNYNGVSIDWSTILSKCSSIDQINRPTFAEILNYFYVV
ncbi:hypothetical protein DICPUDRAFT_91876 [Dictyostelium purpureum]|uniref:Protein kinase domain-containing protein n=1 Tax=Dictyostelium purpureum TaxID=5786 RepID=F0ZIJ3_DICPU|nr:uncharacterized protein DICPUDRAFT_91876 [Dictyostelium purpureum]EGC36226.1 hypothetical protein DICPUDRAFT_91876 [Dictyostelium purpureum]|eukprot:XP_003287235.1 hypothetical protein DICPUDRAFT_91876 [Dictyostelium purpureum]